MERVIVIGTNHAGTYAVSTIADNYKDDVEVVTYDANDNISFLGCGMALWIGGVIDNPDGLFYANPQMLRDKGIEVYMESNVKNIDFDKKEILIEDSSGEKTDNYDKLILAVGSWPIKPKIEGMDLENVIYAKLYQHAQHAKKIIADDSIKRVGVVGGGYIGVELVEAFKENGKEAIVITNGKVLDRYYDEEFTSKMQENLVNHGIEVYEGENLIEIKGENGKVKSLVTDKREVEVDVVLMSVGFNANTAFLKDTDIKMNQRGVIEVNNQQETSIKDVYAIGDCATIHSNVTDSEEHIALATNAVRTGIVAGHNALGTNIKLNGVQGSNAIHIYGLTMTSTGINTNAALSRGYDIDSVIVEDNIRPEFMPANNKVTIKIIWDKKTLKILGAQIMSKEDITLAIHMFSLAIEVGYTIDKLATLDLFFLPHFNKPENFITKAGLLALAKVVKY